MATQKRKMDDRESEASTIERLRSGELHILSAITEELPDVFTVDILPKLDAKATFNLAQVNKCVQRRGVERGRRSVDGGEDRGTL